VSDRIGVSNHRPMDDTSSHGERDALAADLARRKREIVARVCQLRANRAALAERGGHGSTTADVAAAERAARLAQEHAAHAYIRAARRHEEAADAHERAAGLYHAAGDEPRARHHRSAAASNRDAAVADLRRGAVDHPSTEH
jgi:hypothetical protein